MDGKLAGDWIKDMQRARVWGVEDGHSGQVDHRVEFAPFLALVVHVKHPLAARCHLSSCSPFFLADFSLGAFVTEDLDLAVRTVDNVVLPIRGVLHVRVNLKVKG